MRANASAFWPFHSLPMVVSAPQMKVIVRCGRCSLPLSIRFWRAHDLELRADSGGIVTGAGFLHVSGDDDPLVGFGRAPDLGDQRAELGRVAVGRRTADREQLHLRECAGQVLLGAQVVR